MTGYSMIRQSWSPAAEACLAPVFPGPLFTVLDMARMVRTDRACLMEVFQDDTSIGFVVMRLDRMPGGIEAVIMGARTTRPGLDLVRAIMPALEDLARAFECCSIRLHTDRPGLVRRLSRMDWREAETVMRKELLP